MAVADSGSWKLFITCVVVIVVFGFILNVVVKPFEANGVVVPHEQTQALNTMVAIANGTIFQSFNIDLGLFTLNIGNVMQGIYNVVMPSFLINFLVTQIDLFFYIPTLLQAPIAIIFVASLGYVIWTLIAMIIP